jgi:hypothetical protein
MVFEILELIKFDEESWIQNFQMSKEDVFTYVRN